MEAPFYRATGCIVSGLIGCFGSLLIWRLTGSWTGWAIMALPAFCLVFYGWWLILKEY